MIHALTLLAQVVARPVSADAAPGTFLAPAAVLRRYSTALAKVREPRVLTFDYTLDQNGMRTLSQTHRVFRAGGEERDETLSDNGRQLVPPNVRVFRGRRNRYTISSLAPHVGDYVFSYIGPRKDAHHVDYVFRLAPKARRAFSVTEVTIDGDRFLPLAITFSTAANAGSGTIAFGRNASWWVPYYIAAQATVANALATEKLAFYTYRFPPALPTSTFSIRPRRPTPARSHRAPLINVTPLTNVAPLTKAGPFKRSTATHIVEHSVR